jgi:hypothetical protein
MRWAPTAHILFVLLVRALPPGQAHAPSPSDLPHRVCGWRLDPVVVPVITTHAIDMISASDG